MVIQHRWFQLQHENARRKHSAGTRKAKRELSTLSREKKNEEISDGDKESALVNIVVTHMFCGDQSVVFQAVFQDVDPNQHDNRSSLKNLEQDKKFVGIMDMLTRLL